MDKLQSLQDTWVYLSASPLFHLTLTLVAFQAASWLFEKGGRNPLLNPVLGAVIVVVAVLLVTGTDYATYFEGAQFVHFMLGPATVALAVPLWRNLALVRRNLGAMAAALLAGSVTAAGAAILIASSDLGEVAQLCHRAVPFVHGRPGDDIPAAEFSESRFIQAITGDAA